MKDVIPKDTCTEETPPSQGVETPVRAQTGGDATGSRGEAAGAQSGLDTPSSCCFFILVVSVPALPAPRGFM